MYYALLIAISSLATVAGIISVFKITKTNAKRLQSEDGASTAVSVLKPLCGTDDQLKRNLETFFRQTHPNYELIFGVQGPDDPAADMVRNLRKLHPNVPCRLVVHDGGRGINPKVSNLRAMLEAVKNDVLVISDSNIAVRPTYLTSMLAELQSDGTVGLVTNLFVGTGAKTLGASLETLHLNGPVAASVAGSKVLVNRPVTVGKSMMFRRSQFEKLGGFESVANLLAEDYVIGRMFREAGYDVRIAPDLVFNVCQNTTVRDFLRRHLRWGAMRFRLNPVFFLLEPLSNPLTIALLAPLFGLSLGGPLLWAMLTIVIRDFSHWMMMHGRRDLQRVLPLGIVKELLVLGVWFAVPFVRTISWRGSRVSLSAGTRLYASKPYRVSKMLVIEG